MPCPTLLRQRSDDVDTNWSWVMLAVSCVVSGLAYAFQFIVGIYYEIWLRDFHMSRFETAWLTTIPMMTIYLCSPAIAAVCRKVNSDKSVTFVLFLFIPISMLATSFVSTFSQLYVTYGLLLGIGTCTVQSTQIFLVKYFDRHMSVAMATISSSSYASALVLSPLCSFLIESYGWRGSLRVLAVVYAVTCIPCILAYRDHCSDDAVIELSHRNFTKLLKVKHFWLLTCSFVVLSVEFATLNTHLIEFAKETIPAADTAKMRLLTIFSYAGNIVGRIVIGVVIEKAKRRMLSYQITLWMTSVSAICGLFCNTFWQTACFLVAYGFFEGGSKAQLCVVIVNILGKDVFPEAFTLIFALQTPFMMAGPMIVGGIVDLTGDYNSLIGVLVAVPVIATLPLFLLTENNKEQQGIYQVID